VYAQCQKIGKTNTNVTQKTLGARKRQLTHWSHADRRISKCNRSWITDDDNAMLL